MAVDIEEEKRLIKQALYDIEVKAEVEGMVDYFTTIEEAQARAEELGGSGYHELEVEGETVYMPFDSHADYEAAIAESKDESYDDYPQAASNNAKRMLGWIDKYGRDVVTAGTNVGLARAQQLSSREPISLDVLKRTRSYLERAKTYSTVDPKHKDEPWLDNGFVAYNLWGGEAMREYANKKLAELEDNA